MSHTILIINRNGKLIFYLNPKSGISKSQNEIEDKFNLNSEAMCQTKYTLLSSVIRS
jgi:hypothetical protein